MSKYKTFRYFVFTNQPLTCFLSQGLVKGLKIQGELVYKYRRKF